MNNPGLNVEDINVPEQEPSVEADRAPHGEGEYAPEPVDTERTEELTLSAPRLDWWLEEKYFWKQNGAGKFYLSPHNDYLSYTIDKAYDAAIKGASVLPGTSEEELVKDALGSEVINLLQSLEALHPADARAFGKFLVERCTRNAVYAATTQYELVKWSENAAAKGQKAHEHQNFGEKQSRAERFMIASGALYVLIKDQLPEADLSRKAFENMAKRVVYNAARMESDKAQTPAQATIEDKESLATARMTAELF